MDAQNIYDDPDFHEGYMTLGRQVRGLDGAAEWPTLRLMLPDIAGLRVVDLGCGAGWFTRFASDEGATHVLGVDVSSRMLEHARSFAAQAVVEYRQADLDLLDLAAADADLVFSSLALHYVHDLDRLLAMIAGCLVPGGSLVFSVEHPIYSAPREQTFRTADNGDRFWPLDNYLVEGKRVTNWFVDGVVKEHRTVATYVNSVITAGFVLDQIIEWGPTVGEVASRPELADDLHRPWFLLVQATQPVVR